MVATQRPFLRFIGVAEVLGAARLQSVAECSRTDDQAIEQEHQRCD
jgi:hypothetical protein